MRSVSYLRRQQNLHPPAPNDDITDIRNPLPNDETGPWGWYDVVLATKACSQSSLDSETRLALVCSEARKIGRSRGIVSM